MPNRSDESRWPQPDFVGLHPRGPSRRELLQAGTLAWGGLSLSSLLALRAQAAETTSALKDASVVFLFLTGGPSQIETFDPKMSAPSEIRSATGEIATSLAGVTFGGTFPQLARRASQLALVRSFSHNVADHTLAVEQIIRGGNSTKAGSGAIAARLRGNTHRATGMPTQVYLGEDEVDPQFLKERQRLLDAAGPGTLGSSLVPFEPGGNGPAVQNMTLNVSRERLDDRRALRTALDRWERRAETGGMLAGLDQFEQQAFELLVGKSRAAFDLSQEDPRVVARYDTSRNRVGLKKMRPSTLGRQLLLARRLCESGCGFVTIHNAGWDMHGGPTQLSMHAGMEMLGRPVDHAVSAFLDDVAERGLSQKILLVIAGEFGRSPLLNQQGGRDHWPQLSTLALAGGGLRMGQVVGRSNAKADAPLSAPVTPPQLLATILHVLFDLPQLRLQANLPREIASIIEAADPIRELI